MKTQAASTRSQQPPTERAVVLRVDHVAKRFGDFQALEDVSLHVRESDVIAVIGPSGSGKSTLVRCIHQLETIDSGSIHLDDELLGYREDKRGLRPLTERQISIQRRRVGMVFQTFNLFPHMTALRNITEAQVRAHGTSTQAAEKRARHLLDRVGLSSKEKSYPIMLSGGEQQRVAIARALAPQPRIMLFDEPTSALDPELIDEVMTVIRDLAQSGRTMIVVTHDIAFARDVADVCVFMEKGRVIEMGPPSELLHRPTSDRLKAFLSRELASSRRVLAD